MMHPGYRLVKHLPEFADNRAMALFGSLVLQAGLSHFAASRLFGSTSAPNEISFGVLSGSSISNEALEPFATEVSL